MSPSDKNRVSDSHNLVKLPTYLMIMILLVVSSWLDSASLSPAFQITCSGCFAPPSLSASDPREPGTFQLPQVETRLAVGPAI